MKPFLNRFLQTESLDASRLGMITKLFDFNTYDVRGAVWVPIPFQ